MRLRIGCGLGSGCRCAGRVGVSRGRVSHHHHWLAGLRRQGDAGKGQMEWPSNATWRWGLPLGRSVPRSRRGNMARRCFPLRTFVANRARRGKPTTPGSCPIPTLAHTRIWGAAAGAIIIANWLACDDMGTRGTGRGGRWRGGITRMGLVRGRGGGSAAAVNALSGCTQVTTTETPPELQTKCHLIASRY